MRILIGQLNSETAKNLNIRAPKSPFSSAQIWTVDVTQSIAWWYMWPVVNFFFYSFSSALFSKKNKIKKMGLLKSLDTLMHGGVQRPESYERKKKYHFGDTLGNRMNAFLFWHKSITQSENMLGCGSYGYVKKAIRIEDNTPVAIKIIPKSKVIGHFDMVYAEMHVLEGLSHPNIIGFYDWFESR